MRAILFTISILCLLMLNVSSDDKNKEQSNAGNQKDIEYYIVYNFVSTYSR